MDEEAASADMNQSKEMIQKELDKKEFTEKELLEQILEENNKRTFYSKIAAISAVGILAVVVICLFIILPRVNDLIRNTDEAIAAATTAFAEAENAAAGLTQMSDDIITVSESVNTFVTENSTVIADAMEDISNIDYEGLNSAIKDLKDAVEPFAKLINRFK